MRLWRSRIWISCLQLFARREIRGVVGQMESLVSPFLRLAIVLPLASGCVFGVRTGTGVSRSTGEAGKPDASGASKWLEVETGFYSKFVRGMFVLGAGSAHTRLRPGATIIPDDDGAHGRLGFGLGVSPPESFMGLRPVPYVLYNYNGAPSDTKIKGTLELGVDLEIEKRLTSRTMSTFVLGVALTRESGVYYWDSMGIVNEGEFDSTGFLMTFGWHFVLERFTE